MVCFALVAFTHFTGEAGAVLVDRARVCAIRCSSAVGGAVAIVVVTVALVVDFVGDGWRWRSRNLERRDRFDDRNGRQNGLGRRNTSNGGGLKRCTHLQRRMK